MNAGTMTLSRAVSRLGGLIWACLAAGAWGAVRDPGFEVILERGGSVHALAALDDGSVLVGGEFHQVDTLARNALVLLDANGRTVPSFDAGIGAGAVVQSVLVQPDGRILVGGWFGVGGGTNRSTVVRVHRDGSLDETFRLRMPDPLKDLAGGISLTLDPAGHLFLVATLGGVETHIVVARLMSDGVAEPERCFLIGVSGGYRGKHPRVHVLPDGRFYFTSDFRTVSLPGLFGSLYGSAIRLRADGYHDPGFQVPLPWWTWETGGSEGADYGVFDSALLPDGRLILAGAFDRIGSFRRPGIAIVHPDGALDLGFRPDGLESGVVDAILPDSGGAVFAAGRMRLVGDATPRSLVRLLADGRLDPGHRPVPLRSHPGARINTMIGVGSGTILLGGARIGREEPVPSALAAFGADGEPLDAPLPLFRDAGLPLLLQVDADRSIFVGGAFDWLGSEPVPSVAKLRHDGSRDTTFQARSPLYLPTVAATDPEGGLFLAGFDTDGNQTIVRLGADGLMVPGFVPPELDLPVVDLLPWTGDRLIVASSGWVSFEGRSFLTNCLFVLGPDGSRLADAFPDPPLGSDEMVRALAPSADGGFHCGVNPPGGSSNWAVIRIGPDGRRDPGFRAALPGGGADQGMTGSTLTSLAVDGEGRMIAGVDTPGWTDSHGSGVVRFLADGTWDAGFVTEGIRGSARKVLADSAGGIVALGSFNVSAASTGTASCVRFLSDGRFDAGFPRLQAVTAMADDGSGILLGLTDASDSRFGRIHRYLLEDPRIEWNWIGQEAVLVARTSAFPGSLRWEMSTDLETWLEVPGGGAGTELRWNVSLDGGPKRFFRVIRQP